MIILILEIYRAHVFTASGTFVVSELSTGNILTNTVDISSVVVVVEVGDGHGGGGGGAGGFRTNSSFLEQPGSAGVSIW